jgi:tetratricopeptide (TPR) repeat protein
MDLMKRIVLFLACLVFAASLAADEWQNLFREGNAHYQRAEYDEAIEKYNQIIRYGNASGELYFNLGNACYKLEKMGQARLNYERARRFMKNDEALDENLKLTRFRLVDQIQKPPQLFLMAWWEGLLDFFIPGMLSGITVIMLWIFLAVTGLRLFYSRRNRHDRTRPLFTITLIVFVLCVFLLVQKIYQVETEEFAVILNPMVTVFAEPRSGGTEVFILHEGAKVQVQRKSHGWLEIKLEDGKTGWLESKTLEII